MATSDTITNTPYGYCQCGCGQKTTIADRTDTKLHYIKYEPKRFMRGHHKLIPLLDRLWSKVNKQGSIPNHCPEIGNCWEWMGTTISRGYGTIYVSLRGYVYTHRISWEIFYGEIQDGLWVLHKCDNPSCVNPAHLFLGTGKDNVDDMISKGRKPPPPYGEESTQHKLSTIQIEYIRSEYAKGQKRLVDLAAEFDVHYSTISLIVNRKRRKRG